jgi:flagellar motility protein MotE (MotC chaperone)
VDHYREALALARTKLAEKLAEIARLEGDIAALNTHAKAELA